MGQEDEGGAGGNRTSVVFVQATRRVEREEEFFANYGDVDTVQCSLFHFGVNKFISGVNSYNLGVIVQPGCEANHTCEQDNLV